MIRRALLTAVFAILSMPAYADCTSPSGAEGHTRYDFTAHGLFVCTGTSWVNMASSGSGLSGGTSGYLGVWSGATTMGLSGTSAGQQLFWDGTNNRLGIGTVNPGAALHIHSASSDPVLRITRGGGAQVDIFATASAGFFGTVTNHDVVLRTSNLDRIFVGAAGNVGIGTTSPASMLQVAGGVQIGTDTATCPGASDVKVGTLRFNTGALELCTTSGWVSVGSGGGSGNTMMSGWPDAIQCYGTGGAINLYHSYTPTSGFHEFVSGWTSSAGSENLRVRFNSAKTWVSAANIGAWTNFFESNCNSSATTIASLYSTGRAFNFVGGGTAAAAGASGQVQFFEGSNLQADADLTWDNTNKRLGIGTTSPGGKLDVRGTINAYSLLSYGGLNMLQPSSSTSNQGLSIDVVNMAAGSNGLFITAPAGWTGNYISANLNGVQKFRIDQTGLYTQSSDRRLKTNIRPIKNALAGITQLDGVTFTWKEGDATTQLGVIAQQVQSVFPEAVRVDDKGYLSVSYPSLIAPLIGAVKELKADNDNLRVELKAANDNYKNLRDEVDALKAAR